MEFLILGIAAFLMSGLTFFSGFGLGTLLMPLFAIFFPVETAVTMTAVVHLFNNMFKLGLTASSADRGIILKFGLPACAAAFAGAWLLGWLSGFEPLSQYSWMGRHFQITPVKLAAGILIMGFAVFETLPRFKNLSVSPHLMPFGGLLSGFFGGLSGHQGALRSVFLLRCGLNKEAFIGTGVAIACLVDLSRLAVYGTHFSRAELRENATLLVIAMIAAGLGALSGSRLLKKVTLETVQRIVAVMLFVISAGLISGLI